MSDLNWCTYCDNAIQASSDALYCSDGCLRADTLHHHPLLGYDYPELQDFPRRDHRASSVRSTTPPSSAPSSPLIIPMSNHLRTNHHLLYIEG